MAECQRCKQGNQARICTACFLEISQPTEQLSRAGVELAEPIANLWHPSWESWADSRILWSHSEHNLTVGDVRKARAILKMAKGGE